MWAFLFPFVPSYFPLTRETDTKKAEQFCNIQFLNDKGNHKFFQETKLSYRKAIHIRGFYEQFSNQ